MRSMIALVLALSACETDVPLEELDLSVSTAEARARPDLCPEGFTWTTNLADLQFGLLQGVELPQAENLTAYCHWLQDGYIGFHWDQETGEGDYQCPDGSRQTTNGAELEFCLWEDLDPHPLAQPYCYYLEDGYMGYSWPLDADGDDWHRARRRRLLRRHLQR